jgi:CBS domain containing-hemolysin-like protein
MTAEHASVDALGVAWRLGATLFFVVLNGFFVAAEFALVKVRSSRIDELASTGSRRARSVQHILAHLDRYLSACQLGITLSSLILGALGEPAVSVLLIAGAGTMGFAVGPESPWLPVVSILLAFLVITMLHMTLGEQAPKMWALRRAEVTSLQTSLVLRGFTLLFGPFISAVNAISNWMLRVAGLPADGHHDTHTAEEIRSILSIAARSGHLSEHEYELTENVFRVMSMEVRHLVVPRVDVEFLSLESTPAESMRRIRESKHSRLPLCEVGLDSVVGVVHVREALDRALERTEIDLRALAHAPVFVPDTMSLTNFLRELQGQQGHCAIVLDGRGTAIGLAFREDALEEIVGPLGDEFDEREQLFRSLGGQAWEVSGGMSLPELCDRLELELDEDEDEGEDTIGGHVTARLGRLPQEGDTTHVGPYVASVLDATGRRVQRLRLKREETLEPEPDGPSEPRSE